METSIYSFPMFHPRCREEFKVNEAWLALLSKMWNGPARSLSACRGFPGNLRGTEWTPKLTTSNGIPQKSGRWFSCLFSHPKEVPRVPCFWKMLFHQKETKSSHDQFCRDFPGTKQDDKANQAFNVWLNLLSRQMEPLASGCGTIGTINTQSTLLLGPNWLIPSRSGETSKTFYFHPEHWRNDPN